MTYGFNDDKSKAEIYVAIIYPTSSPTISSNSTGEVLFDTSQIDGEILGLKNIIFFQTNAYGQSSRANDIAITGYEVDTNTFKVMVKNISQTAITISEFSTQAFVTCITGTVREIDTDTDD